LAVSLLNGRKSGIDEWCCVLAPPGFTRLSSPAAWKGGFPGELERKAIVPATEQPQLPFHAVEELSRAKPGGACPPVTAKPGGANWVGPKRRPSQNRQRIDIQNQPFFVFGRERIISAQDRVQARAGTVA